VLGLGVLEFSLENFFWVSAPLLSENAEAIADFSFQIAFETPL
jgi:hypothetical protein